MTYRQKVSYGWLTPGKRNDIVHMSTLTSAPGEFKHEMLIVVESSKILCENPRTLVLYPNQAQDRFGREYHLLEVSAERFKHLTPFEQYLRRAKAADDICVRVLVDGVPIVTVSPAYAYRYAPVLERHYKTKKLAKRYSVFRMCGLWQEDKRLLVAER